MWHVLRVIMPLRRNVTVGMMMRTKAAGSVSAHVLHDDRHSLDCR